MSEWQRMTTAPREEIALFWVRAKTADESYVNSSGDPVVSNGPPHLHIGKFATWSSLSKAIAWMPFPDPPTFDTEGKQHG